MAHCRRCSRVESTTGTSRQFEFLFSRHRFNRRWWRFVFGDNVIYMALYIAMRIAGHVSAAAARCPRSADEVFGHHLKHFLFKLKHKCIGGGNPTAIAASTNNVVSSPHTQPLANIQPIHTLYSYYVGTQLFISTHVRY